MTMTRYYCTDDKKPTSSGSTTRFSFATAGYRIFRLSIELFLVEYTIEAGNPPTFAGYVFLAYSLADILAGLFALWYPQFWFGSMLQGSLFFIFSVATMAGGFIGLFFSSNLGMMAFSGSICGIGTATWFVNYQTLTNKGFAATSISQIAQRRQVFECLGFLLPSIVLATVNSQSHSDFMQITKISVIVLSILGVVFFTVSSSVVISCAANIEIEKKTTLQTESVWMAVKALLSAIMKYFWLDTIILASVNIMFATLSVITEHYFGLEPSLLWLAAIAFPIGGAFSALCSLQGWFTHGDDRRAVLNGCLSLTSIFTAMILLSPIIASGAMSANSGSRLVNKSLLLFFGLVVGYLYSKTLASAFALWLHKLHQQPSNFVARANVLHNVGVQIFIAAIFQIHMTMIEMTLHNDLQPMIESLVYFGPLIIMFLAAYTLTLRIPFPSDPKFGWPVPTPFTFTIQLVGKLFAYLTASTFADLANGMFNNFRTSLFAPYLSDDTVIQGGPCIDPGSILSVHDLKIHLKKFDELQTEEQWWESSSTLKYILMSNQASFSKRLELIENANSSICLVAWSLDGLVGGLVADKLIEQSQKGVDVRVIVDAVNLYFLSELSRMKKAQDANSCLTLIGKLSKANVKVQMLDSWYNKDSDRKPYVIGSHRKIMLVDDEWLLTGGRNLEDSYVWHEAKEEKFKFHDTDVVLSGDFSNTTGRLFEELWVKSRSIDSVLSPKKSQGHESVVPQGATEYLFSDLSETMKSISENEFRDNFLKAKSSSRIDLAGGVSLVQIDHKGGRTDGSDMVLTTLIFIIEVATYSIDLMFGYFQLFPIVQEALKRAVARGVTVRLFTNNQETNDMSFCNGLFRDSFCGLLELGVKVYVPASANNLCIHTKGVLVDSRAFLLGSWNAIGFSVFYEEEFTVVMFADEDEPSLFEPVKAYYEGLLSDGFFIQMTEPPKEYVFPAHLAMFCSKYGLRQVEKGF